jgi:hypothetical protein
VGTGTVSRATELTLAIDKIVATTGIPYSDILSGKMARKTKLKPLLKRMKDHKKE